LSCILGRGLQRIVEAHNSCKHAIRSHTDTCAQKRFQLIVQRNVIQGVDVFTSFGEGGRDKRTRAGPMNIEARQPTWVEMLIEVGVLAMLLTGRFGDKGPAV
jgi:hypothetical protein